MKCSECGHSVGKKAKFCSECGNRLSVSTKHTQGKSIYQNVDSLLCIELLIALWDVFNKLMSTTENNIELKFVELVCKKNRA